MRASNLRRLHPRKTRRSVTLAVLIAVSGIGFGSTASQAAISRPRPDIGIAAGPSVATGTPQSPRITAYPIAHDPRAGILFGDGKVWTLRENDLRPFDLAAGGLIGQLSSGWGGPVFADGNLWVLRLNLDHECAPSNFPQVLVGIDLTTSSVTKEIELPGWCRYINDNRSLSPLLVAGGGAIWITGPNRSTVGFSNAQVVRVDTATGSVDTIPLSGTRAVVAADEGGAWVAAMGGAANTPRFDNGVEYLAPGPTELDRVDQAGSVVAPDLLPSARFQSPTYAADPGGLWVTYAKTYRSSGTKHWTMALARVTPSGKSVVADRVSPWSVATGDGQVWFLGTRDPGRTAAERTPRTQILGRIDPKTGRVLRTIRLHLPVPPPSMKPPVVKPRILSVMDDGVWIDPAVLVGPARQQQLIRVSI